MLKISTSLRLAHFPCTAFVGAGGKTTAMFKAARESVPSIVTTSTHLGEWQSSLADFHLILPAEDSFPDNLIISEKSVTLVSGQLDPASRRYKGLTASHLESLKTWTASHDLPLLIEADGARQKSIKAPADFEPVIPAFVDQVVVVAGLDALRKPLSAEIAHRVDLFTGLSGLKVGEIITAAALASMLTHPSGGLKNLPSRQVRRVALLTHADSPSLQSVANKLAEFLLPTFNSVLSASLKQSNFEIKAAHESIAAVILAAGTSNRFGTTKQLLEYHGKPFIRVIAETALSAGLAPVLVISGAEDLQLAHATQGLPVEIIQNSDWSSGQSTSLKLAVRNLPRSIGGAIFLLADQPQISVELLRSLVERHSWDLPPILAPLVLDRRANPVLFDQMTFNDLMKIEGDQGGRAIFPKFPLKYLNWIDSHLLLDVDTPDDYQQLLNQDSDLYSFTE